VVKQVGGTYYTSFIVTLSAIYSTDSAYSNENGIRTVLSPFWGMMQLPASIKFILRAQFHYYNVLLVD